MEPVVSRLSSKDVVAGLFPHVVTRTALDGDVCDLLIAELPPLDLFTGGRAYGSNQRFNIHGCEAARDPRLSPLLRELVGAHQSQQFLDQLMSIFTASIRGTYPWFEDQLGPLDRLRAGVRFRDSFDQADVLIEAQPAINTPVTGRPSSVRAGHLDNPNKLFVGLVYLRHPDDDSTGGDLELYRYASRRPAFDGHEIADKFIEPAAKVPYARNTAILFLNTDRSLHGVTARSRTTNLRLFLNLNFEVKRDLFAIPGPSALRRAVRRARTTARRKLH